MPLPPVTFTPTEIDNRVDGLVPAAPPLYRPRISEIATEYGSDIAITYAAPACSRVNNTMPSSPATNTMPCFPVYWTPAGESSPIQDWFNKSLVTQVDVADETGAGSPAQVTSYSYLGGAAWHHDDSPLTQSSQRTWDQFRGYAQVETTTGAAPDPVTETVDTYMRGHGRRRQRVGRHHVGERDRLAGRLGHRQQLAGRAGAGDRLPTPRPAATVDAKAINGPWTFSQTASQAQPDGLPALTAQMPQATESRSLALLANGTWRTVQTDTTDNADDQVAQVDAKGDGTASDPEICTTTTYASSTANPMMESYPSRGHGRRRAVRHHADHGQHRVGHPHLLRRGRQRLPHEPGHARAPSPAAGRSPAPRSISGYSSSGSPQYQTEVGRHLRPVRPAADLGRRQRQRHLHRLHPGRRRAAHAARR